MPGSQLCPELAAQMFSGERLFISVSNLGVLRNAGEADSAYLWGGFIYCWHLRFISSHNSIVVMLIICEFEPSMYNSGVMFSKMKISCNMLSCGH